MGAPPPSPPPLSALPPATWSVNSSPQHHMNPWPLIVAGGRALGVFLIFLGTLIAVVLASVPSGCFASPPSCTGFLSNAATGLMWGKIFWVLGLFFLGATSGIRLSGGWFGGSRLSAADGPDAAMRFRANLTILILSILLLMVLLLTINSGIAVPIP